MDELRAREVLGDGITPDERVSITKTKQYANQMGPGIDLDGFFTIEELEAIVWWMKNKNIIVRSV